MLSFPRATVDVDVNRSHRAYCNNHRPEGKKPMCKDDDEKSDFLIPVLPLSYPMSPSMLKLAIPMFVAGSSLPNLGLVHKSHVLPSHALVLGLYACNQFLCRELQPMGCGALFKSFRPLHRCISRSLSHCNPRRSSVVPRVLWKRGSVPRHGRVHVAESSCIAHRWGQ